jgi:integrase/recombinase XerC
MTGVLDAFELHMRTAKLRPDTITKRLEVVRRLAAFLEIRRAPSDFAVGNDPPAGKNATAESDSEFGTRVPNLLSANADDLAAFQGTFAGLAPASVDIYSRHVRAFYKWALDYGHVEHNLCTRMVDVKVRKGLPHPTGADDLRVIFACTRRPLRTAYVLAAFAGLRCGEICRLRWEDLTLAGATPRAFIHGKGGRERITPLLPPVVDELQQVGLAPRGPVVVSAAGRPYSVPNRLSIASSKHLTELGVATTLHSLRHYFGTATYRATKDVLLTRDLLGHESVATTEIYMQTSMDGAHERLAAVSGDAVNLLDNGGNPQWLTT